MSAGQKLCSILWELCAAKISIGVLVTLISLLWCVTRHPGFFCAFRPCFVNFPEVHLNFRKPGDFNLRRYSCFATRRVFLDLKEMLVHSLHRLLIAAYLTRTEYYLRLKPRFLIGLADCTDWPLQLRFSHRQHNNRAIHSIKSRLKGSRTTWCGHHSLPDLRHVLVKCHSSMLASTGATWGILQRQLISSFQPN